MASLASNKPDPIKPLVGRIQGYPQAFLEAIDKAMQTLPDDRLQSAKEWRNLIAPQVKKADVNLPDGPGRRFAPLSLTDLVKQTNEEVRKTKLVEENPKPAPVAKPEPKPEPARRRTQVINTTPDWAAEFNEETHAEETRRRTRTRVRTTAFTPEDFALDAPLDADADPEDDLTLGLDTNEPQEPPTNDWVAKARERERRRTQTIPTPRLDAVLAGQPPDMNTSQGLLPEEMEEMPPPPPTLRDLAGPLFKYLSTGIVIGLSLILIQITYFA